MTRRYRRFLWVYPAPGARVAIPVNQWRTWTVKYGGRRG
jgi:hypothetical protein